MLRLSTFAALAAFAPAVIRALAATFGGYAVTQCFSAALALALHRGMQWSRGEALVTSALFAFVVYLLAALRAFTARSVRRAWFELLALAAVLAAAAWHWAPRP